MSNKMRKIGVMLVMAVLFVSLAFAGAVSAATTVADANAIAAQITAPSGQEPVVEGNIVILKGNSQLNDELDLALTAETVLNLNGKTLTAANSKRLFTVSSGTFILKDGSNGKGKLTGGSASLGGGVYVNGGTFWMTGGKISGCTATSSGGGVYVKSGTFKVNGAATIIDNKVGTNANNVCLNTNMKVELVGPLSGMIGIYDDSFGEFGTADGAFQEVINFVNDLDGDKKTRGVLGAQSASKYPISWDSALPITITTNGHGYVETNVSAVRQGDYVAVKAYPDDTYTLIDYDFGEAFLYGVDFNIPMISDDYSSVFKFDSVIGYNNELPLSATFAEKGRTYVLQHVEDLGGEVVPGTFVDRNNDFHISYLDHLGGTSIPLGATKIPEKIMKACAEHFPDEWFVFRANYYDGTTLYVGDALNDNTGKFLPNVKLSVGDGKEIVFTNSAGEWVFDKLSPTMFFVYLSDIGTRVVDPEKPAIVTHIDTTNIGLFDYAPVVLTLTSVDSTAQTTVDIDTLETYTFFELSPGVYNLVASYTYNDNPIRHDLIKEVTVGSTPVDVTFTLLTTNVTTAVKNLPGSAASAPVVSVDGLDKIAAAQTVAPGQMVTITFSAIGKSDENTPAQIKLKDALNEEGRLTFIDFTVTNTTTDTRDGSTISVATMPDAGTVLTLYVAYDMTDRINFEVLRIHGDEVEKFVEVSEKPEYPVDRTFYLGENGIYIYSRYFSEYLISSVSATARGHSPSLPKEYTSSGYVTPTVQQTAEPTATPTPAAPTMMPTAKPTATTSKSPAPFIGLVLGLGAAALVLARMRR